MRRGRVDPQNEASVVGKVTQTGLRGRTATGANQVTSKYGPRAVKEAAEEKKREQQRQVQLHLEKDRWANILATLQKQEQELHESMAYTKEQEIPVLEQLIENLIDTQEAEKVDQEKHFSAECEKVKCEMAAIVKRRMDLQVEQRFDEEQTTHAEEALLLTQLERDEALNQIDEAKNSLAQIQAQRKEVQHLAIEAKRGQDAKLAEETLKKSDGYGVSEDVARIVSDTRKAEEVARQIEHKSRAIEMERREKFNKFEELKGTIRVYCRIKGGSAENRARLSVDSDAAGLIDAACPNGGGSARSSLASVEGELLRVTQSRLNATSTGTKDINKNFKFDRVYSAAASQSAVFDDVGTLIDSAVDGYKVCILAYGQTGSGKTHTMEGPAGPSGSATVSPSLGPKMTKQAKDRGLEQLTEDAGVIPRSINKIFGRASVLAEEGWTYTMHCSFLEIYNDTIRDLLETSESYHKSFAAGGSNTSATRHEIRHNGKIDTTVSHLQEKLVHCPADVHKLLQLAVSNRSVAKTQMNERSSRSHCVFTMKIDGVNKSIGTTSKGNLCLVDLAGSERVNDSGAQGQQKKEAVAINQSLSALGDCINAMGTPKSVVSWRSNKLTYLLQNYLGGEGAKMLMFVMISNKEEHVRESLNSLEFAEKVNNTHIGTAKKRQ